MYKFYVFTANKVVENLNIKEAIEEYKKINGSEYKAIGVRKDYSCCDLLNNLGKGYKNKISQDYKKSSFKQDRLITINALNILRSSFNLED
ncbi:hypothetical protein BJV85_002848 [Clostridium acetobutylicum]|uniref:Uncharacterized protein n=1 Tax=Clostridium acetobutylicum (strain ATCC 824 / DSM 792 / JCM 1419 / IAM 19013 / LMG 5710 / NBRC 13948 / NRRL B-527 / VKM B-1787 / 2291 / W) TaxID=272562 RepID=Q97JX2_CLOAB|nr:MULTISPECIES: hypothetical protein [Clostridium]AAK79123.1 Hypothetical protein CA_C1151 [Clostridium acetobutylicum ATCC 824]ADZ20201.1 Conserved hypothetical protein [Clostridium acetobutylicum EA 2018]AEI31659.1 hypothetical protein SMB_G1171 [Clostridium acetobutylicum DSM 1731]AWV81624.1 hypothetical protein DK921_16300 [Clostridium acetobutylicum]MBC2393267.1 hypothetical protein [Clostridium acetobutylicum]